MYRQWNLWEIKFIHVVTAFEASCKQIWYQCMCSHWSNSKSTLEELKEDIAASDVDNKIVLTLK